MVGPVKRSGGKTGTRQKVKSRERPSSRKRRGAFARTRPGHDHRKRAAQRLFHEFVKMVFENASRILGNFFTDCGTRNREPSRNAKNTGPDSKCRHPPKSKTARRNPRFVFIRHFPTLVRSSALSFLIDAPFLFQLGPGPTVKTSERGRPGPARNRVATAKKTEGRKSESSKT